MSRSPSLNILSRSFESDISLEFDIGVFLPELSAQPPVRPATELWDERGGFGAESDKVLCEPVGRFAETQMLTDFSEREARWSVRAAKPIPSL